ncbi:MAG TPA: diadenylate cyclase CdaA [Anaerolineae bacterium]|nr:diadenylate cyclase CdaA [Anaerolineae bacterium]HQH37935.1 diadenylate cyclase CdaA [Anaerolineae bacterium]
MWNLTWLLERISWVDGLDILIVAVFFYIIFYTIKGTRAVPLVRGITALLISLALLTRLVPLRAFTWLIDKLLPALLVAIPVLFQPELRRALEQLGRNRLLFTVPHDNEKLARMIGNVVKAVSFMATNSIGALIVFERQTGLQEYIDTGVPLDAEVTFELLTSIFDHHVLLHDGAVIIRRGRLAAAGCVMPLTTAFLADRELGLRHRAALGTTEEGDAVAVVVSEERGTISVTHNGRIIRDIDTRRLDSILRAFLLPEVKRTPGIWHHLHRHVVKPTREIEGGTFL